MAAASGWRARWAEAAPSTSRCPTTSSPRSAPTKWVSATPSVVETLPTPNWNLERTLWERGLSAVAGVDEAGRGALAGPVVAAVVLLPAGRDYPYRDSKQLQPAVRARLAERIRSEALVYACGYASAALVDQINVLEATKRAARAAVTEVYALVDGLVTDYLVLSSGLPE